MTSRQLLQPGFFLQLWTNINKFLYVYVIEYKICMCMFGTKGEEVCVCVLCFLDGSTRNFGGSILRDFLGSTKCSSTAG